MCNAYATILLKTWDIVLFICLRSANSLRKSPKTTESRWSASFNQSASRRGRSSLRTLWYGGTGADTSQKLMAMQIGDLPSGAAEGIRKSLVAMGNKAPTDTDVLNLYRKLHASK